MNKRSLIICAVFTIKYLLRRGKKMKSQKNKKRKRVCLTNSKHLIQYIELIH